MTKKKICFFDGGNMQFTLNEKTYRTDRETIEVLRDFRNTLKGEALKEMFAAVMCLGLATGRIREL